MSPPPVIPVLVEDEPANDQKEDSHEDDTKVEVEDHNEKPKPKTTKPKTTKPTTEEPKTQEKPKVEEVSLADTARRHIALKPVPFYGRR